MKQCWTSQSAARGRLSSSRHQESSAPGNTPARNFRVKAFFSTPKQEEKQVLGSFPLSTAGGRHLRAVSGTVQTGALDNGGVLLRLSHFFFYYLSPVTQELVEFPSYYLGSVKAHAPQ